MRNQSKRVIRLEWGEVELEDGRIFKDVKIFPDGAREWLWGETGTRHQPGVQFSDVKELLENGAETVVLTRGRLGRLRIPHELVNQLEAIGIEVYVAHTQKAVERYNRLCESKKVGILIHSTC